MKIAIWRLLNECDQASVRAKLHNAVRKGKSIEKERSEGAARIQELLAQLAEAQVLTKLCRVFV